VAWIVGDFGTVMRTDDGGTTWARQSLGSGAWMWAVGAASPAAAWVLDENGVIHATTDGGRTWTLQLYRPTIAFPASGTLGVAAADNVWAAGTSNGTLVQGTAR
jgi:photosystem II stability/assembly factor-like uncharacterized protein